MQPKGKRHTTGDAVMCVTGGDVHVETRRIGGAYVIPVISGRDSDEHADLAAAQSRRVVPRMLERLPTHFENEALLRIHASRLARRDSKERRIEFVDAFKKAAAQHRKLRRKLGVELEIPRGAPPTGRYFCDRIHAVVQQLPVGVRAVGSPGKTAAEADDGDRLGA